MATTTADNIEALRAEVARLNEADRLLRQSHATTVAENARLREERQHAYDLRAEEIEKRTATEQVNATLRAEVEHWKCRTTDLVDARDEARAEAKSWREQAECESQCADGFRERAEAAEKERDADRAQWAKETALHLGKLEARRVEVEALIAERDEARAEVRERAVVEAQLREAVRTLAGALTEARGYVAAGGYDTDEFTAALAATAGIVEACAAESKAPHGEGAPMTPTEPA